jgi:hypothetical protein
MGYEKLQFGVLPDYYGDCSANQRIQLIGQIIFVADPFNAFYGFPILKENQAGDSHYMKLQRQGFFFVNVDFGNFGFTGEGLGQFIDDGIHDAAGTTPGGPEVYQDWDITLDDLGFKIVGG